MLALVIVTNRDKSKEHRLAVGAVAHDSVVIQPPAPLERNGCGVGDGTEIAINDALIEPLSGEEHLPAADRCTG